MMNGDHNLIGSKDKRDSLLLPSLTDNDGGGGGLARKSSLLSVPSNRTSTSRRKSSKYRSSFSQLSESKREELRKRDRARFIDETPIFEGDMAPDFVALDAQANSNLMPTLGSNGEKVPSITSKLLFGSDSSSKKSLNSLDTTLPKTALVTLGRSFNDSRRVKFGHSYRILRKADIDEDRAINGLQFDPSEWIEIKKQAELQRKSIPIIQQTGSSSSGELARDFTSSTAAFSRTSINSNSEYAIYSTLSVAGATGEEETAGSEGLRRSSSMAKKDGLTLLETNKIKTKTNVASINAVTSIKSGWRSDYPPTLGSDNPSKWEKKMFLANGKSLPSARPNTAASKSLSGSVSMKSESSNPASFIPLVSRPKSAVMIKADRLLTSASTKRKQRPKTSLTTLNSFDNNIDAAVSEKLKRIEEGDITLPPDPPTLPMEEEEEDDEDRPEEFQENTLKILESEVTGILKFSIANRGDIPGWKLYTEQHLLTRKREKIAKLVKNAQKRRQILGNYKFDANTKNVTDLSRLPLELFDNTDLETIDPIKLLADEQAEGKEGVNAFSRYFDQKSKDESWEWAPCLVKSYDSDTGLFTIIWKGENLTNVTKQVRRLNLFFEHDNRDSFYTRLEMATETREALSTYYQYCLEIDRSPDLNYFLMPTVVKKKIFQLIASRIAQQMPHDKLVQILQSCFYELEVDYIFIMKLCNMQFLRLGKQSDKSANSSIYSQMKHQRFAELAISHLDTARKNANHALNGSSTTSDVFVTRLGSKVQPLKGGTLSSNSSRSSNANNTANAAFTVTTTMESESNAQKAAAEFKKYLVEKFAKVSQEISSHMFLANIDVQTATLAITRVFATIIQGDSFFQCGLNDFPYSFYYLEEKINIHAEGVLTKMQMTWSKYICRIMEEHLSTSFDLKPKTIKAYLSSRLKNYLSMVNFIMETQLRHFIVDNLKEFLRLLRIHVTEGVYDVKSMQENTLSRKESASSMNNLGTGLRRASSSANHNKNASLTGKTEEPSSKRENRTSIIVGSADSLINNSHVLSGQLISYYLSSPLDLGIQIPILFSVTIGMMSRDEESADNDNENNQGKQKILVLKPTFISMEHSIISLFRTPLQKTKDSIQRIEHNLLPHLNLQPVFTLNPVSEEDIDQFVKLGSNCLLSILRATYDDVKKLLSQYRKFQFLLQSDIKASPAVQIGSPIENFRFYVKKYAHATRNVHEISREHVAIPPLDIDCYRVKTLLESKSKEGLKHLTTTLEKIIEEKCEKLSKVFQQIHQNLSVIPRGTKDWLSLRENIENCKATMSLLTESQVEIDEVFEVFTENSLNVSDDVNELYWSCYNWPAKIDVALRYAKDNLIDFRDNLVKELNGEKKLITDSLDAYLKEVLAVTDEEDINRTTSVYTVIISIRERLDKIKSMADSVRERETYLETTNNIAPMISDLEATFSPYETVWTLSYEISSTIPLWMDLKLADLDSSYIVATLGKWRKTFIKVGSMSFKRKPVKLIRKVHNLSANFARHIQLILALKNPRLKAHHWSNFSKQLGISIDIMQTHSLRQLLSENFELQRDFIVEMSDSAVFESKVDVMLEEMGHELRKFNLEILTSGPNFIKITNGLNILDILDTQIQHCYDFMKDSKVMSRNLNVQKISSWSDRLLTAQTCVEYIITMQDLYPALVNILSHNRLIWEGRDELKKKVMTEFLFVEKIAKTSTDMLKRNPKLLNLVNRTDYFLSVGDGVKKAQQILNFDIDPLYDVMRGMAPRLYFLDNSMIIGLLRKIELARGDDALFADCFPGIKGAGFLATGTNVFEEQVGFLLQLKTLKDGSELNYLLPYYDINTDLTSKNIQILEACYNYMNSSFNLRLPFVYTQDVIDVLNRFDLAMKESVRKDIEQHVIFGTQRGFGDWILESDIQYVSIAFYIICTRNIEDLVRGAMLSGFKEYRKRLHREYEEFIRLIQRHKKSVKWTLKKIEWMITALFQAMESVESLCQVMTSRGSLENEWNSQIRFYMDKGESASASNPGDIYMRLGVNQIKYGYEYIGTMPRLIIAPSTTKAFDHLIEAIRQNTLCCFYGPSDIGKRETINELASMTGHLCYFKYCDQYSTPRGLVNFLRGALSTKSWVCYINIPTLSNSTLSNFTNNLQLLQKILALANITKTETIKFLDSDYSYDRDCALFTIVDFKDDFGLGQGKSLSIGSLFKPTSILFPDISTLVELYLVRRFMTKNHFLLAKKIAASVVLISSMIDDSKMGCTGVALEICDTFQFYKQNIDTLVLSQLSSNMISQINFSLSDEIVISHLASYRVLTKKIPSEHFDRISMILGNIFLIATEAQNNQSISKRSNQNNDAISEYEGPMAKTINIIQQYLKAPMTNSNQSSVLTAILNREEDSENEFLVAIKEAAASLLFIDCSSEVREKVHYMERLSASNSVLLVVGSSFCGKTTLIRLWEQAKFVHQSNNVVYENINVTEDNEEEMFSPGGLVTKKIRRLADYNLDDLVIFHYEAGPQGIAWSHIQKMDQLTKPWKRNRNNFLTVIELINLASANPAMVAKCGLVVIDDSIINFKNLIDTFLQRYIYNDRGSNSSKLRDRSKSIHSSFSSSTFSPNLANGEGQVGENLDGHFLINQLDLLRNFLAHIMKSCLQTCITAKIFPSNAYIVIPAIQQCLSILLGLIRELSFEGYERLTMEEQGTWIVSAVFFSSIWAFGGRLEYSKRVVFDKYVRIIFQMKSIMKVVQSWNLRSAISVSELIIPFPEEGLVFDYFFSDTLLRWMPWEDMNANNSNNNGNALTAGYLRGNELIFDSDSVRFSYLIGLLLLKEHLGKGEGGAANVRKLSSSMVPIMIEGPAGVGKTSILRKALNVCFQDNPNVSISTIIANPYLETETFADQIRRNTIQRGYNRIGPEAKNSLFLLIEDLDEGSDEFLDTLRLIMRYKKFVSKSVELFVEDIGIITTVNDHGNSIMSIRPSYRHRAHFTVLKTHDDEGSFLCRVIPNMFQHIARMNTGGKDSTAILEQMTEFSIKIYEQFRNDRDYYPENNLFVFDTRKIIESFRFLCANYKVFDVQFLRAWTFEVCTKISDQLMDFESVSGVKNILVEDFGVPDIIRYDIDIDNSDNCRLGLLKKDNSGERMVLSIIETVSEAKNEIYYASNIRKSDLDQSIIENIYQMHYDLCISGSKILLTQLDCSNHQKITELAAQLSHHTFLSVPYFNYSDLEANNPGMLVSSATSVLEGPIGIRMFLEDKINFILGKVVKEGQDVTVFVPEQWIDEVNDHVFINSLLNGISVKELFPKANLDELLEDIKFKTAQKTTTNYMMMSSNNSNDVVPVVSLRLAEQELSSCFREKVHFVFSFSGSHTASQYVVEKLPAVKRHCQTLRVKVPAFRRLQNVVNSIQSIKELKDAPRDLMIFLEGLPRELMSLTKFPLQYLQASLLDGVSSFSANDNTFKSNLDDILFYYNEQTTRLVEEQQMIEKGIIVVSDCEEQIMGLKKKMSILSSKILEVGGFAGEHLKLIDSSQELAKDSKLLLDRLEFQVQKNMDEYNQCKTIYQRELSIRVGAIQEVIKEISQLDSSDVMDLYYSRNGGRPVQTLVNFVNIVLTANGSSVNMGQALTSNSIPFNHENFTSGKLASFKPENFLKITGIPELNQMSFITLALEQTNLTYGEIKTYKFLRDLIVYLYQYRNAMNSDLHQKYDNMINQEKTLMKLNDSVNEEKKRWQEFHNRAVNLTKELDLKLREKGLLEHELKQAETTFEESITCVDKLVYLIKRWKTNAENVKRKQTLAFGNALYLSVAQTIMTPHKNEVREAMRRFIREKMQMSISLSPDPYEFMFNLDGLRNLKSRLTRSLGLIGHDAISGPGNASSNQYINQGNAGGALGNQGQGSFNSHAGLLNSICENALVWKRSIRPVLVIDDYNWFPFWVTKLMGFAEKLQIIPFSGSFFRDKLAIDNLYSQIKKGDIDHVSFSIDRIEQITSFQKLLREKASSLLNLFNSREGELRKVSFTSNLPLEMFAEDIPIFVNPIYLELNGPIVAQIIQITFMNRINAKFTDLSILAHEDLVASDEALKKDEKMMLQSLTEKTQTNSFADMAKALADFEETYKKRSLLNEGTRKQNIINLNTSVSFSFRIMILFMADVFMALLALEKVSKNNYMPFDFAMHLLTEILNLHLKQNLVSSSRGSLLNCESRESVNFIKMTCFYLKDEIFASLESMTRSALSFYLAFLVQKYEKMIVLGKSAFNKKVNVANNLGATNTTTSSAPENTKDTLLVNNDAYYEQTFWKLLIMLDSTEFANANSNSIRAKYGFTCQMPDPIPSPPCGWLDKRLWQGLVFLGSNFSNFAPVLDEFPSIASKSNVSGLNNGSELSWEEYLNVREFNGLIFPGDAANKLDGFEKILLLRLFRPDTVVVAIDYVVKKILGESFVLAPVQRWSESIFRNFSSVSTIPGLNSNLNSNNMRSIQSKQTQLMMNYYKTRKDANTSLGSYGASIHSAPSMAMSTATSSLALETLITTSTNHNMPSSAAFAAFPVPVLFIMKSDEDVGLMLKRVAEQNDLLNILNPLVVSPDMKLEASLDDLINDTIEKGKWILIQQIENNPQLVQSLLEKMMDKFLEQYTQHEIHQNQGLLFPSSKSGGKHANNLHGGQREGHNRQFMQIKIFLTTDFDSHGSAGSWILSISKRVFLDPLNISFRQRLSNNLEIMEDKLMSSTIHSRRVLKKLIVQLIMLHSLLAERMSYYQASYQCMYYFRLSDLWGAAQRIRDVITGLTVADYIEENSGVGNGMGTNINFNAGGPTTQTANDPNNDLHDGDSEADDEVIRIIASGADSLDSYESEEDDETFSVLSSAEKLDDNKIPTHSATTTTPKSGKPTAGAGVKKNRKSFSKYVAAVASAGEYKNVSEALKVLKETVANILDIIYCGKIMDPQDLKATQILIQEVFSAGDWDKDPTSTNSGISNLGIPGIGKQYSGQDAGSSIPSNNSDGSISAFIPLRKFYQAVMADDMPLVKQILNHEIPDRLGLTMFGLHENAAIVRDGINASFWIPSVTQIAKFYIMNLVYNSSLSNLNGVTGSNPTATQSAATPSSEVNGGTGMSNNSPGPNQQWSVSNGSISFAHSLFLPFEHHQYYNLVKLEDCNAAMDRCNDFLAHLRAYKRPKAPRLDSKAEARFADRVMYSNYLAYNDLFELIMDSLEELVNLITGCESMNERHIDLVISLSKGFVPTNWTDFLAFASPLWNNVTGWMSNFYLRIEYFQEWNESRQMGKDWPMIHDLSKFLNAEVMIQAFLRDYAQSSGEPFDSLELEANMLGSKPNTSAARGWYVTGIYLRNASYDFGKSQLKEGKTLEHVARIPCIWLQPSNNGSRFAPSTILSSSSYYAGVGNISSGNSNSATGVASASANMSSITAAAVASASGPGSSVSGSNAPVSGSTTGKTGAPIQSVIKNIYRKTFTKYRCPLYLVERNITIDQRIGLYQKPFPRAERKGVGMIGIMAPTKRFVAVIEGSEEDNVNSKMSKVAVRRTMASAQFLANWPTGLDYLQWHSTPIYFCDSIVISVGSGEYSTKYWTKRKVHLLIWY